MRRELAKCALQSHSLVCGRFLHAEGAKASFNFFEGAADFRQILSSPLKPIPHLKPATLPIFQTPVRHPAARAAPSAIWSAPKTPVSPRMLAPLLPLTPDNLEYRRNLSLRRRRQV